MTPEQIETPGDVDQRADIYSLGVVFYELLTGELPLGRFVPPSQKSPMDPRIDEIVMRTPERDRQARYQTAGEVKTRVAAVTQSGTEGPAKTAGALATPIPVTEPPALMPETARFATASAILTGISLLLCGVAVCAYAIFEEMQSYNIARYGHGLVAGAFPILIAASLLVVGVPAILGVVLGAKSGLGTGNQKNDLRFLG
jgi:hypothetical protein